MVAGLSCAVAAVDGPCVQVPPPAPSDSLARLLTNTANGNHLAFVDVDEDGWLDLLKQRRPHVLDGAVGVSFTTPGCTAIRFRIADLNADGLDDVVVTCTNRYLVMLNKPGGDSAFTHVLVGTATNPFQAIVHDIDGDGDPDIVSTSKQNALVNIYWFENNGAGTGWTAHTIDTARTALTSQPIDANNDGATDMLILDYNGGVQPTRGYVSLWLNSGDDINWLPQGTLTPHEYLASWYGVGSQPRIDFDQDGNEDFATCCHVFFGRGDATFKETVRPFACSHQWIPYNNYYIDLNVDGKMDLLSFHSATGNQHGVRALINLGNRDWDVVVVGHFWYATDMRMAIADIDNDGDLDLFNVGSSGVPTWLENRGSHPLGFRTVCLSPSCTTLNGPGCLFDQIANFDTHHALRYEFRNPGIHTGCPTSHVRVPKSSIPLQLTPSPSELAIIRIDCNGAGVLFEVPHDSSLEMTSMEIAGLSGAIADGTPRPAFHVQGVDARLTLRNVTISNAVSTASGAAGGAVSVGAQGELTLSHATFRSCTAGSNGGAIHAYAPRKMDMIDVTFDSCASPSHAGGAVALEVNPDEPPIIWTDVAFKNNSAQYGGALSLVTVLSSQPSFDYPLQLDPEAAPAAAIAVEKPNMLQLAGTVLFAENRAEYGDVAFDCSVAVVLGALHPASAQDTARSPMFTCVPQAAMGASSTTLALVPWLSGDDATVAFVGAGAQSPVARVTGPTTPITVVSGGMLANWNVSTIDAYGKSTPGVTVVLSVAPESSNAIALLRPLVTSVTDATGLATFPDVGLSAITAANLNTDEWLLATLTLPGTVRSGSVPVVNIPVRVRGCGIGWGAERSSPISCAQCPDGLFSFEESGEACVPIPICPINTARTGEAVSSTSLVPCTCLPGYWSPSRTNNVACVSCPFGAICSGTSTELPSAQRGFYDVANVTGAAGVDMIECPRPNSCAGASRCSPGTTGFMCTVCEDGYYTGPSGECEACGSTTSTLFYAFVSAVVVLSIVAVVIMAVMARLDTKSQRLAAAGTAATVRRVASGMPHGIKSGILFLQILAVVGSVTEIRWPSPTRESMNSFSFLNLSPSVVASECVLGDFGLSYIFSVFVPTAVFLLIALSASLARFVLQIRAISVRRVLEKTLFILGPMLYITCAQSSLVLFDCTKLPSGEWMLDANPSFRCYTSKWLALVPFGVFAIAAYVLGLPAFLVWRLHAVRRRLDMPEVQARLGMLYSMYRREYYLFEIWLLGKRLALVAASMFASQQVVWLLFALILLFVASAGIQLRLRPYNIPQYNDLELQLNIIIAFTVLMGSFFWVDDFPNDASFAIFVVMTTLAIVAALALLTRLVMWELTVKARALVASSSSMSADETVENSKADGADHRQTSNLSSVIDEESGSDSLDAPMAPPMAPRRLAYTGGAAAPKSVLLRRHKLG
ncbi:uncharacterized protein AMSG_10528 [Thecamonas trahens ATCC 50062]|uniref:DUF7630 domain-containing protein n=1 Tax=Thecamonas trahens ATCC 50062 TaxID=461836 RepID=A0A0L0DRC8_THETB|nr:hypothetical protein AMSG_10528 [Thecamonas trahens ATCC 50062]KNC54874.1 hypothetical protein AMSG_10528 [Thecamonas trahens ATCC 50062]|eukprot:XP_013753470.1 hypothetical protein AMSG_10528 [Thecamonas trahens ATCC 50062]